jgi:hypothetical protein
MGDAFGGSRSDHHKLTQPTRDTVAEHPSKIAYNSLQDMRSV